MGGASGYMSGRFAAASQISSLQRRRFFLADSSLTPRFTVETPQQPDWNSCSAQLALPGLSPADLKEPHKRANSEKFETMPRRHCKTCRAPLHADDGHAECVSCLGKSHADAALSGADCSHYECFSLSSLRSWIAFFSESDSAPRGLPFSSSQGPARKKQWGRGFERPETSEHTSAQCPRALSSAQRVDSPVLFTQPEQRPSAVASDMISFGGSDDEMDDSLSLAATDGEELSGSVIDPALLPPSSSRSARPRTDEELVRVMKRAVNELGLEWYPSEEPSRSRLDEWFLPGRQQAPRQRSSPFFPEVHDELTKSWRAPYSSRICPSASSALTSVDRAEEKGYEHLPPLDESVAAHLCPPTSIGWKARASHPSKPCRATSALAGHAYSAAGQAASALHSMAVLQVFQAKMLANKEAGLDAASLRDLRSATDLALRATKATAQAIGRSMSSLVVLERHLWLTLTEMKEADKVPFLDAPVSLNSLFVPAVEGFAERFTEAQKSSQAMRHFLPKRACSAASSRPKPAPTQQPAKLSQPLLISQVERGGPESRYRRTTPQAAFNVPRHHAQALGAEESVFLVPESKYPLLPTINVMPLCSQSLEPIQPLATQAEAWQAIPGVSEWVMATIIRGYSLQFARRPPCFRSLTLKSCAQR